MQRGSVWLPSSDRAILRLLLLELRRVEGPWMDGRWVGAWQAATVMMTLRRCRGIDPLAAGSQPKEICRGGRASGTCKGVVERLSVSPWWAREPVLRQSRAIEASVRRESRRLTGLLPRRHAMQEGRPSPSFGLEPWQNKVSES